jgi:hypothetical protein
MKDLKSSASTKEKSVLDYVMKDVNLNKKNAEVSERFESISKNFNSIREIMNNMQRVNERECRMKINEFIVNFEQNMQVLLSLANLFEQKTIFEIEKKRNSILQLITQDNLDPNARLQVATEKLEELHLMIKNTFESVKSKIQAYEDISDKKISRARGSFMVKIKKFLK